MTEVGLENTTEVISNRPTLTPEGERWFSAAGPVKAVREFVAGIKNEVGNAIGWADNLSSILAEEMEENPKIKFNLEGSTLGTRRITKILKRLMQIARVSYPDYYDFKEIPLGELIGDTRDSGGKEYSGVEVNCPSSLSVLTDEKVMSSVLKELFNNSIEAGATRVEVNVSDNSGQAEIKITDNGEGISLSPDQMFCLNSSTKMEGNRKRELSIGLFVAKTAVLAHGGSIEIKNRKDTEGEGVHGAVVIIRLPLIQTNDNS